MLSHLVCYQALAFWVERHSENDSSHHVPCRRSQVQHDLASGSRPPRAHCCTACDRQAKFNWLFSCCQFFNLFSQTGTRPPAFLQPRLVLKPVSGSAELLQMPVRRLLHREEVSRYKTSQKLHTVQFFGLQAQAQGPQAGPQPLVSRDKSAVLFRTRLVPMISTKSSPALGPAASGLG